MVLSIKVSHAGSYREIDLFKLISSLTPAISVITFTLCSSLRGLATGGSLFNQVYSARAREDINIRDIESLLNSFSKLKNSIPKCNDMDGGSNSS